MEGLYRALAELAEAGTLPEAFRYPFITRGLIAVLLLAPLLGSMSHLVVARRLAFFSTAIGQAALTGITLGILLGEPIAAPYGGLFGFCFFIALVMTFVKRRSSLPPDTMIGVFMAITLGLGVCLLLGATQRTNIHQIEGIMFGSLLTVTDVDLLLLLLLGAATGGVLAFSYNQILLDSLDPALAQAKGVRSALVEYLFVMLLTAAIVVSLKIIGALLVEALVVVPAAAARSLSRSTRSYLAWSIATALAAGFAGMFVSASWSVPTGGAVVLCLGLLFFVALAIGAVRDRLFA
jgi:zinc transport system permease protein